MQKQSVLKKVLSLTLVCALLLSHCLLPVQALAWGEFSLKDEKELGEKFNVLIRSRLPLVQDPEILNYVTDIVNRVAHAMPTQPFPFTVGVIQHNAINAFACPGGFIFVHTGLLLAMKNESELA